MSNYISAKKNPKTGEIEQVEMLDDFYGRHRYGVRFPDGTVYKEEFINKQNGIKGFLFKKKV